MSGVFTFRIKSLFGILSGRDAAVSHGLKRHHLRRNFATSPAGCQPTMAYACERVTSSFTHEHTATRCSDQSDLPFVQYQHHGEAGPVVRVCFRQQC